MEKQYKIHQGDNLETLALLEDNSIDSVVTDPPYGIDFLGKEWDSNTGTLELYKECLRVLKPGGYILAFSAARTYHHLATSIEKAGFEIRDQLMWLYASGFPKAQDMGKAIQKRQGVKKTESRILAGSGGYKNNAVGGGLKDNPTTKTEIEQVVPTSPEAQQWAGWKTALKPAHEPIVMARKPFKGSCVDNVLDNQVGALNIDDSRVAYEGDKPKSFTIKNGSSYKQHVEQLHGGEKTTTPERIQEFDDRGRYPSNVIGQVDGHQKHFYNPNGDHEPIVMARKPFKGSCIDNVLDNGVGALNIDETRIDNLTDREKNWTPQRQQAQSDIYLGGAKPGDEQSMYNDAGRYPSNVIGEVTEHQQYFYNPNGEHEPIVMARKPFKGSCVDNIIDNGVGALNIDGARIPTEDKLVGNTVRIQDTFAVGGLERESVLVSDWTQDDGGRYPSNVIGDVQDYQKYFYCPKVSRSERHAGYLDDPKEKSKGPVVTETTMLTDMGGYFIDNDGNRQEQSGKDIYLPDYGYIKANGLKECYSKWAKANKKTVNQGNNHPTVKPVALMKYLIKLVTPPNSRVLDPYTGSGSTGMAAVELGHQFIGCELDPDYVAIAERRIQAWSDQAKDDNQDKANNKFADLFE